MSAPGVSPHVGLDFRIPPAADGAHAGLEFVPTGEVVEPPAEDNSPEVANYSLRFRRATPARACRAATWATVQRHQASAALRYAAAQRRLAEQVLRWYTHHRHGAGWSLPWGPSARRAASESIAWRSVPNARDGATLPWGPAPRDSATAALPWRTPRNHRVGAAIRWDALLERHSTTLAAFWQSLASVNACVALPWGPAGRRNSDVGVYWPREPPPGTDPITVPFLPVYFMIPTLEAWLLPGEEPLPILSASIAGDADSWAWTFSAPIPYSALELVNPASGSGPAEIAIAVNGHVWTFVVEGFDDNRRFGSRTATIRGRSRSALLAQPFSATRTYTQGAARTFAQLAEEELTGTGWTLAWDAVSALLPAGTFSYQDLAPMDAIARLASSIGAAVQSHMADKAITVDASYPDSPWTWDAVTPYAILPASIMTQGSGSWQGGSNAAGIHVYGENSSYGGFIKLAGTDGAPTLPMITDSLLISADPVRERGRIELARAGVIKTETRTYPLFADPAPPGLVPIGKLVEVQDHGEVDPWRGLVKGVRIEANRSDRALVVRQQLTIERQFR